MRHHRSYAMHPPCPTNSPVPVPVPAARPIVPMPRTAAALAVFDAQKPQLEALWAEAECNDDVYAAIRAEKEAWLAVQEAFATESPNSLERCRLVEPNSAWLRQLVERSQRENQEVVMGLEEKRTGGEDGLALGPQRVSVFVQELLHEVAPLREKDTPPMDATTRRRHKMSVLAIDCRQAQEKVAEAIAETLLDEVRQLGTRANEWIRRHLSSVEEGASKGQRIDLEEEASTEVVRAWMQHDVFAAVRGLCDWIASSLAKSGAFAPQPIPTLTDAVATVIAARYALKTSLVHQVYARFDGDKVEIPPVGVFSRGTLTPHQRRIHVWMAQYNGTGDDPMDPEIAAFRDKLAQMLATFDLRLEDDTFYDYPSATGAIRMANDTLRTNRYVKFCIPVKIGRSGSGDVRFAWWNYPGNPLSFTIMPTNADGIIERGLARLREDIEQKLKSHAKRIEEAKIEIDESQRRQAVRKEFEALFGQCVVRGSDPPTVDLTLEGVPVEMARELAIWLKAKGYPRGEAQEQEQEQEQES